MIWSRLGAILLLSVLIVGIVEIKAGEGDKQNNVDGTPEEGKESPDQKSQKPAADDEKKSQEEVKEVSTTPTKDNGVTANLPEVMKKSPPPSPPSETPPTSVQHEEVKQDLIPKKETKPDPKQEKQLETPAITVVQQENHKEIDKVPAGKEHDAKSKQDPPSATPAKQKPTVDDAKTDATEQQKPLENDGKTSAREEHTQPTDATPQPSPQTSTPTSTPTTEQHQTTTEKQHPAKQGDSPQPTPTTQRSGGQTDAPTPKDTQAEAESYIMKGIQMFDKKGYVKNLVGGNLTPIPADLTGKSDEELKNLTKILIEERNAIQQRYIVHTSFMLLIGIGTHYFTPHSIIKSGMKYVAEKDDSYSSSIDNTWTKHQERVANFALEYMRVKNIKPESLPKSNMDIPFLTITLDEKNSVNFPVWRTQKDTPLPPEATSLRLSKSILQNWYIQQ